MATTSVDQVTGYGETLALKAPCRLATTANIVLSDLQTIDGVATAANDRVLVRIQDAPSQNGIYIAASGAWRRARDMDSNRDLTKGTRVYVTEGDTGPAEFEITTENPINVGSSSIAFDLSAGSVNAAALSAAAARAEEAADIAEGFASDIVSQGNVPIYAFRATAQAENVPLGTSGLRLNGGEAVGDGGKTLYKKVVAEPTHPGKIQTADGAWWELTELRVNPFMFGAAGDTTGAIGSGTDDTAEINAMFAYALSRSNAGKTTWATLAGGKFRITDTVGFDGHLNVDFEGGILYYDGPRDRPAVQVGDPTNISSRIRDRSLLRVHIESTAISWADDDYVGLRIYNVQRCRLNITEINGFNKGYELYSLDAGCAYNRIEALELLHNKYGEVLTCDGSSGLNYANENIFIGGRRGQSSSTAALGSCYGVLFRSINGGYQGHNCNRWISPAFEMGDGVLGDERIPFLLDDCGGLNVCHDARFESGRGPFARLAGTTYAGMTGNSFGVLYAGGGTEIRAVVQEGLAFGNRYIGGFTQALSTQALTPDLVKCVSAYNTTDAAASGGIHFLTSGAGTALLNTTNISHRKNSIVIASSSRAVGFFARCNGGDHLCVSVSGEAGFPGRIGVALFDTNFQRLTNVSPNAPHISDGDWSVSWGGAYVRGTDATEFIFSVSSDVKYIGVHVSGGTAAARIRRIALTRLDQTNVPVEIFGGLPGDQTRKAAADPTGGIVGEHAVGDIIGNAVAASAAVSYWQCTTAGRLAPAWAISTAYVVGQLVLNDTDKIYECVTAGTSAGAGGPTGTGSAIADNTVVWDYLSPKAVFSAGPTLA
ncbi:MAG: hypothetical protein EOQ56_19125 [Mesorhizobium sp.]|nr:MAG: hypothetical protein EOQ56_19125 [Mesorhizobium sp.]